MTKLYREADFSSNWMNDAPIEPCLLNPILDTFEFLSGWTDERIKECVKPILKWLENEYENNIFSEERELTPYEFLEEELIFYPKGQAATSYIFNQNLSLAEAVAILILYEARIPNIENVYKLTTILSKIKVIDLEFYQERFLEFVDPDSDIYKNIIHYEEKIKQRKRATRERSRPHALLDLLSKITTNAPDITWKEVLRNIEGTEYDNIILSVNDDAIEWMNYDGKIKSNLITTLPKLITKAKQRK